MLSSYSGGLGRRRHRDRRRHGLGLAIRCHGIRHVIDDDRVVDVVVGGPFCWEHPGEAFLTVWGKQAKLDGL